MGIVGAQHDQHLIGAAHKALGRLLRQPVGGAAAGITGGIALAGTDHGAAADAGVHHRILYRGAGRIQQPLQLRRIRILQLTGAPGIHIREYRAIGDAVAHADDGLLPGLDRHRRPGRRQLRRLHIGPLTAALGIRCDHDGRTRPFLPAQIQQHRLLHHTGIAPYRLRAVSDDLGDALIPDVHLRIDEPEIGIVHAPQQQAGEPVFLREGEGEVHPAEGLTLCPALPADDGLVRIFQRTGDPCHLPVKELIPVILHRRLDGAGLIRHLCRRFCQDVIRRSDHPIAVLGTQFLRRRQRRAGDRRLGRLHIGPCAAALRVGADDHRGPCQLHPAQIHQHSLQHTAGIAPHRCRAVGDDLGNALSADVYLRIDKAPAVRVDAPQQQPLELIPAAKGEGQIHLAERLPVRPALPAENGGGIAGAVDPRHLSVKKTAHVILHRRIDGAGLIGSTERCPGEQILLRYDEPVGIVGAQHLRCDQR